MFDIRQSLEKENCHEKISRRERIRAKQSLRKSLMRAGAEYQREFDFMIA